MSNNAKLKNKPSWLFPDVKELKLNEVATFLQLSKVGIKKQYNDNEQKRVIVLNDLSQWRYNTNTGYYCLLETEYAETTTVL